MVSNRKAAQFKAFVELENPDIVLASETYLDSDIADAHFLPDDYVSIRSDGGKKIEGKHGVLIAHRANLLISEVKVVNRECEIVTARMQCVGSPDLFIASYYRHCDSDPTSLHALGENMSSIGSESRPIKNLIIGGDFNLPSIHWDSGTVEHPAQYGKALNQTAIDTMSNLYVSQLVEDSTRGSNILDLIFSSTPDLVSQVRVVPGISDHQAVVADINFKLKISKKPSRTIYMYDKANKEILKSSISSLCEKFFEHCHHKSASENWQFLKTGILEIVEEIDPQKKTKTRYSLPWLSGTLRKKINKKNRYHKRAKKASPAARSRRWQAYINIQEQVQIEIAQA